MLFNSFIFWAFFAGVLTAYWLSAHRRQNVLLLAASYVFYGYWDWRFLFLLAASTLVDYWVGHALGRTLDPGPRKWLVSASLVVNLGALGFFKYFNFFADEFARILELAGLTPSLPVLNIILPVGVSFYTFQSLSYTIDVYRGKVEPIHDLIEFALYVSFFPQLVAGPIERSSRLLPQIRSRRSFDPEQVSSGLQLIAIGLLKKVIVADNLAPIVERTFSLPNAVVTGPDVLVGVLAFTFQIYADFSGYSDMARGLAKMLGIELMVNFREPYLATNPSDFWHRWHISLSTWLRDYLYIPLGGSRRGTLRTYRNLMTTMLLGGLWHGAAWNFVLWGGYHGVLLAGHQYLAGRFQATDSPRRGATLRQGAKVLLMFCATCYGWLLFRAESYDQVVAMTGALLTSWQFSPSHGSLLWLTLFFALPIILAHLLYKRLLALGGWLRSSVWGDPLFHAATLMILMFLSRERANVFIYFQF